jgi:hypothetical protein
VKKPPHKRKRHSYFPVDAPSIARAVEEGVLMSRTALTMSTMNHIIVGALRHGVDYDEASVARFVTAELHQLALEQAAMAEHIKRLMVEFPPNVSKWRTVNDHHLLVIRRVTYSALSSELARLEHDGAFVSDAVDSSRDWAWSELQRAIEGRLDDPSAAPEYERERGERMRAVQTIDLPALAARQASVV